VLKLNELLNGSSCLNRASPDEPIFVLRAKDICAAQTIRLWAAMAHGKHEPEKLIEAREIADEMEKWREIPNAAQPESLKYETIGKYTTVRIQKDK
jgi:hypothetical protein